MTIFLVNYLCCFTLAISISFLLRGSLEARIWLPGYLRECCVTAILVMGYVQANTMDSAVVTESQTDRLTTGAHGLDDNEEV